jgi:hypothetical protein
MSGKEDNSQQDLQKDCRAGGCKANSQTSLRLQKMSIRTLWRGRPPSKQKKKSLCTE